MLKNLKSKMYAIIVYLGSAAATFTSAAVGTASINSLAFLVNSLDLVVDGSNYLTFTFTESDTIGGSYVAAPAEAYYADHPVMNALPAGGVLAVEYRGNAPFVKLVATETGAVTGNVSVLAVSLDAEAKPSNLG